VTTLPLRLSPAFAFSERPRTLSTPMEDRLRHLVAGVPDLARLARRPRLARVIRAASAHASWAEQAAADPLSHRDALMAGLRQHGMTAAAVGPAFALVRELGARILGTRAYDVQLLGAYAMLRGHLAEMATGEGKTLTAAITAAVAALSGKPVHVVTVNDYLARRDAELLGPLYAALGLRTGLVIHGKTSEERRAAYESDIVYVSNKELAFDYLRDQILRRNSPTSLHLRLDRLGGNTAPTRRLVMRGLWFAIVDEADSVLVDEARTPLIISESGKEAAQGEVAVAALSLADQSVEHDDYTIDHADQRIWLTPAGCDKLARLATPLGGDWESEVIREELVVRALSAQFLFRRDEHYLVRSGKVQIIDEYTGRIMPDRFWNDGLHQLIEVKEGCAPTGAKDTIARITYQRFFTRYRHLCGMSGTLAEVAHELRSVYGLTIARIPTNRPCQRRSEKTRIMADLSEKWRAIAEQTRTLADAGRPVLIGTRTVAASLQVSRALTEAGLEHELLNAEQDAREAEIVAEAGRAGRITVATNMAGRGTDIRLDPGIAERGGLAVILTERHDAGRIDRQLAGRCARQGDPGTLHPILSLEDSILNPLQRGRLGRALLRTVAHRRWIALQLFGRMQRRAERAHAAIRRALLRVDTQISAALSFAGRAE
jgi:preprotein translocase subunit SecA